LGKVDKGMNYLRQSIPHGVTQIRRVRHLEKGILPTGKTLSQSGGGTSFGPTGRLGRSRLPIEGSRCDLGGPITHRDLSYPAHRGEGRGGKGGVPATDYRISPERFQLVFEKHRGGKSLKHKESVC